MSWLTDKSFPITTDLWWTFVTIWLALGLVFFAIGEISWGLGLKNFEAYTYWIRYHARNHFWVLILVGASFLGLGIFMFIHFIYGKGYKLGPNI